MTMSETPEEAVPGTRTQQTSSAFPMSTAATRSMICFSSTDSASIVFISHLHEFSTLNHVTVRGDHRKKQNLVLVLTRRRQQ